MKIEDAEQYCSHSANARPNRIGSAQRERLSGFHQQCHTQKGKHEERCEPQGIFHPYCIFCLTETESKATFAKPGDD